MTNKLEAMYDGQVICPDESLKLEPYARQSQVQVIKMRLALRKKKPLMTKDASQKPPEHTDLSEMLDHYLFW